MGEPPKVTQYPVRDATGHRVALRHPEGGADEGGRCLRESQEGRFRA
jgi:hypothetical protein